MTPPNDQDRDFMRMAIREAKKALGRTSPNPCVGALIVRDGEVVGQGHHLCAGSPHAEVNAIACAGAACAGATIYVTLEPCNHTGRTPPCTRAILAAGLVRVVVGMLDPNPRVAGGGCAFLREQGLAIQDGILAEDCAAFNRPFVKHARSGLPWVVMKAGMSLDGRISYQPGRGGRVTGPESLALAHRLRDRFDAIMIGVETALADDPSLTTRLPAGGGHDPLRVVLDSRLRLPAGARMLGQASAAPTWVFCAEGADLERRRVLEQAGAVVKAVPRDDRGGLDLATVLRKLGRAEISTLLVEGGGRVHGALLARGLVDEAALFVAPLFIGDAGAPVLSGFTSHDRDSAVRLHDLRTRRLGEDLFLRGLLKSG